MLVTANLTTKLTGVPRGARKTREIYVRRRAEIEIRDLPPANIMTVATVTTPERHSWVGKAMPLWRGDLRRMVFGEPQVFTLMTDGGPLLFGGFGRIPEDERERDRFVAFKLLGLPYETSDVAREIPEMRSVESDDTQAIFAAAARAAARLGHVEGKGITVPAQDMYLKIDMDEHGDYESISLQRQQEIDGGSFNCFRLDQYEEAILHAREHGATDADVAIIRENLEVNVVNPGLLRFDPVESRGRAAIRMLYREYRKELHKLPLSEIAVWTYLRDAWLAHQDGKADLAGAVAAARQVHDLLLDKGPFTDRGKRLIADGLAGLERTFPRNQSLAEAADDEALAGLSGAC